MVLVVSHPGPVLDEIAHPTGGPQSAGKSERLGSALSARSRSRNWAGMSFAGRPVRPALRRPRTPDAPSSRAQRLTDWRCTPNSRATSDWLSPCRSNRAASIRRSSNARNPAAHPLDYPCLTY